MQRKSEHITILFVCPRIKQLIIKIAIKLKHNVLGLHENNYSNNTVNKQKKEDKQKL